MIITCLGATIISPVFGRETVILSTIPGAHLAKQDAEQAAKNQKCFPAGENT